MMIMENEKGPELPIKGGVEPNFKESTWRGWYEREVWYTKRKKNLSTFLVRGNKATEVDKWI